jgi:glucose/arabinose dehydrogenase
MLDRICLSLTLPLLLGAVQDGLPANWKTVEFPDGRFSVALPDGYTKKNQKVNTAAGSLEVTMVVGEGSKDTLFVVSYCDYSKADLEKGGIAKRLDYARDGAVNSAGGKLRQEMEINLDRHPGRDLVIEKDGEVVVRTRIYLVENRLYQVMTLGNVPAKEARAFLDSFRLIK